ncbi:hypothetical protein F4677DRAFT_415893 [Hypoxylon crocopeplum]|nr:hypothetical protein F4677DRAFT_415893 [Hypoxylon crocopeplum]
MGSALANKDVNTLVQVKEVGAKDNVVKGNVAKDNVTKDSVAEDSVVKDDDKTAAAMNLEHHRKVLQSKIEEEKYEATAKATTTTDTTNVTTTASVSSADDAPDAQAQPPVNHLLANCDSPVASQQQYVSPSDAIMSPCSVKLSALKGRQASRIKPKSLFAQTSAKKFDGSSAFGGKKPFPTRKNSSPNDDGNGPRPST